MTSKGLKVILAPPLGPPDKILEATRDSICSYTNFRQWASDAFQLDSLHEYLGRVSVCIDENVHSFVYIQDEADWTHNIQEAIRRHPGKDMVLIICLSELQEEKRATHLERRAHFAVMSNAVSVCGASPADTYEIYKASRKKRRGGT